MTLRKEEDKLRIHHADICVRCMSVRETAKHNCLRWCICEKCAKVLEQLLKDYEKNGLYLTAEGKL